MMHAMSRSPAAITPIIPVAVMTGQSAFGRAVHPLSDDRGSILVAPDAERIDQLARQSPDRAYNTQLRRKRRARARLAHGPGHSSSATASERMVAAPRSRHPLHAAAGDRGDGRGGAAQVGGPQ